MIFNLYKQKGETPLECITRFGKERTIKEKMTYLGRLDPLAEGVLLVATGDDIKRKEEFLRLDKEYEFSVIFGFSTDTYDTMGKIVKQEKIKEINETDLMKIANVYEGERDQKYPLYSSKMIAKNQKKKTSREQLSDRDWRESEGIFQQKNTPVVRENVFSFDSGFSSESFSESLSKKITVYKTQFHKLEIFSAKELFGRILSDISKVKGDFRQIEILEDWKKILLNSEKDKKYFVAKFSAHVSSGTYIRSLVNDMGTTLGCGATTLSIKRTRIGNYKIEDGLMV